MSQDQRIRKGDYILLCADMKKWLIKTGLRQFHTHKGVIDLANIIGKDFGEKVKSSLNYDFTILKPTILDHLNHLFRITQIIYPKDIGLIIQYLDICPGKIVLEIGTGSGALAISIANLLRPDGHLYTYEAKKKFAEIAKKNFKKVKLEDYITLRNYDAKKGIEEKAVDAVTIDVGDPWEIIPIVSESLKPGFPLCSFSPTINQVEKTVSALQSLSYADISTLECFVRNMKVDAGKTRPATTMICHTGYLTFARKVSPSKST